MTNRNRNEERRRNGECECHRDSLGHVWSDGEVVNHAATGATMRCTNGKWVKCRVTFAAHQLDPQPCALAQYGQATEGEAA